MRRQAAIGDLPAGRGAAIAAVAVVLVVLVAAPLPVRTVLPGGAVLYTRTDCPA
jgi:hypothetical protein